MLIMFKQTLALLCLTLSLSSNAATLKFTYTSDTLGQLGYFTVDEDVFSDHIDDPPYDSYLQNSHILDLNFSFGAYSWDISDVTTQDHTIFQNLGGSGLPEVQGGAGLLAPGIVLYGGGRISFPGSSLHEGSWSTTSVPVPAAAWLFGSALIGLAGIKRKK